MTPISSVFRPPSQQLQAAFPWHRQWLEKSPSSEGTNPQRRASEWSDWTKLPAAQAFEALKAAHGGTERNQLQQAGDVCRCLGWDDPILKWRISKLWTAYFSLLRAPVSIGHKAGRCWKMLEDAGRCWKCGPQKNKIGDPLCVSARTWMFPPVTTWTGVNFGKFAKPAKAAKIQSQNIPNGLLVGGFNHLENISQWGWDDIP